MVPQRRLSQLACLLRTFVYVRPVATAGNATRTIYGLDVFRDTAEWRCREAKQLLEGAKRRCDGAVACALLSTECALKATLLFGHGVTYGHELPDTLHKRYFQSKYGHALLELYRAQTTSVLTKISVPIDEVTRLDQRDRYEHRYGARRPRLTAAQPVITDAEAVVEWMKKVLS